MDHSRLKIAIAGAGIMGLSAAYALRTHTPTLFDPAGFPADTGASAMAGGMLAPYSEIEFMPGSHLEAARAGMDSWRGNFPGLVNERGSLLVAHQNDGHMLERVAVKLEGMDVCEAVDEARIAALEPDLAGRFERGLFVACEANINPALAMKALGDAVPEKYTEACDLEKLSRTHDWVIDCRGYAAEKDDPELRGVKGEMLFVRNRGFNLTRPVRLMHPRYPLYITPRGDDIFMIGATLIESAGETVALKSAMELLSAAYSLHPSFGDAEIISLQAGVRPAYPDNLPRITIDGNIIRCNGLFRHGYPFAPVMAACAADYIAGNQHRFMHLFNRGNDEYHHQRHDEKLRRHA